MSFIVKFTPNEKGNPPGKLADAELHFTDGVLDGLKLLGFAVWERRTGNGRNVTFPARQYAVNGERRSFALLRPMVTQAHRSASAISCCRLTPSTRRQRPRPRRSNPIPDAALLGGARERANSDFVSLL